MDEKKGQISMEFLIVTAFITLVILGILGIALYYVHGIDEQITFNQLDGIGKTIVATADGVYYAGEPSQQTIEVYFPKGVNSVTLIDKDIVFNVSSASGEAIISYSSKATLVGEVNPTEGYRKIKISALGDQVSLYG